MNKHVLSTYNTHALLFDTAAIIIVFEEATAKGFVQCANGFKACARHHHAEESGSS